MGFAERRMPYVGIGYLAGKSARVMTTKSSVGRDYLVGTVLVLIILAISFVCIRLLNGVVEPEVEGMGAVVELVVGLV